MNSYVYHEPATWKKWWLRTCMIYVCRITSGKETRTRSGHHCLWQWKNWGHSMKSSKPLKQPDNSSFSYHTMNSGFIATEHCRDQKQKRNFKKGLSAFIKARSRRNCQFRKSIDCWNGVRERPLCTSFVFHASVITCYWLSSETGQQIRWPLVWLRAVLLMDQSSRFWPDLQFGKVNLKEKKKEHLKSLYGSSASSFSPQRCAP